MGGVVSGNFGLNVAGYGSTVLSGNNTFTGAVTVSGGTLAMTGNNAYAGNTSIFGGTLAIVGTGALGDGNYSGAISNNGTLIISTSSNQTFGGLISENRKWVRMIY